MADAPRRVLITGIAGQLAGELAARLERDERIEYLAGVDLDEPAHDLTRTEFIRADLRNPLVAQVVESTRVDTIVHLSLVSAPGSAGGRGRMKELNVIGAMQLLAAAQRAERVRRVVVKSTTAVYGSHHTDPGLIPEESPIEGDGKSGYGKDVVEIERYARSFARRRPDATLTLLRFASFIGPTVDSPLTRYLSLRVVPTMLGYDPRVQLCHEDDAANVLQRAVVGDHPGTFNVAGPGVIYLSQALRMAGKPNAPVPRMLADNVAGAVRSAGKVDFAADQLQFLRYGRVGDITRLRRDLGYEPVYATREAFEDFLAAQRVKALVDRDTVQRWERGLSDLLTRRASRAADGPGPPADGPPPTAEGPTLSAAGPPRPAGDPSGEPNR